jgi:hypothetical protein
VTLEVRDGTRTTTLRVRSGATIARAEVRGAAAEYEVAYGESRAGEGAFLPGDVTLSSARPPVTIELGWVEYSGGGPLDPALFRLDPPAGARVLDLDAGSVPPSGPWSEPGPPEPGS